MQTRSITLLGLALAGCTAAREEARPSIPAIAEFSANVRSEISGERARDIVGYVEQFWRVPGNAGFDSSLARVIRDLDEAGYVVATEARPSDRLTYRVEQRPMDRPTWEPVSASLEIVGRDGPLLSYTTNRSMITINSYSTAPDGLEAEVVDVGAGQEADFAGVDVLGKIVYGTTSTARLFRTAVQERGAVGVLSYGLPEFNQPEVHQNSISFGSIPQDSTARSFGLRLSHAARQVLDSALTAGPVRALVRIETTSYRSEELTLIAEVAGISRPAERFVYSAHVQEPGANDNASGVGALGEIARVLATEYRAGRFNPGRTITMIWGDEIRSTARYIAEDSIRARGIMWGLSLDMVGENTALTGGTFLIEKMPDPSAVWTRGADRHTEWGGRPLTLDRMTPHYFNDFAINRCLDQAAETGWVVETNPYEGGSDHVPFLRAGIPGLLFWHFTDAFYHTDGDRLDMVSAATLENVAVCAAVTAMALTSADAETASFVVEEVARSAIARLDAEAALSRAAIAAGEDEVEQRLILQTWTEWYESALRSVEEVEVGGPSAATLATLTDALRRVTEAGATLLTHDSGGE